MLSARLPPLPQLLLLVVVMVTSLQPALSCPSLAICRQVCSISPTLAKRCNGCYPGICTSGGKEGLDEVYKGLSSFSSSRSAVAVPRPSDPRSWVHPEDPDGPTDPVDPTGPEDPTDPVDPEEPENPVDSDDPTDPVIPIVPEGSGDPVNPVDPDSPLDPTNPAVPFPPASPPDDSCLHDGIIHDLHATWFDMEACVLHICTENGVRTVPLDSMCNDPPTNLGNCTAYRRSGECCDSYNCTAVNTTPQSDCVDDLNTVRPHGSSWVDDPDHPCVTFICIDGQIDVLSDVRPLCPPPPSHACISFQPPGQCCNNFNCSIVQAPVTCTDSNTGIEYRNSEIWHDDEIFPCRRYVCNAGNVQLLLDISTSCQVVPPMCLSERQPGRCCHHAKDCACFYQGGVFPHNATFPDSLQHPCRRLHCDNGTITEVFNTPCPPLDCQDTIWPDGQCCRVCDPTAECEYGDQTYPAGAVWPNSVDRPCDFFTCINGNVVSVNSTTCPDRPSPECVPWQIPGVCCPKWDCDEEMDNSCEYKGEVYPNNAEWPENALKPCIYFTCKAGQVVISRTEPPCPEKPGDHCLSRDVPYQCCPAYDCVNITCIYKNLTFVEGDVWPDDDDHPCRWFRCTRTGVHLVNDTVCPALDPPDCDGRPPERLPEQCCKSCPEEDTMCVDFFDNVREEGCIYFNDPLECQLVECVDGVEHLVLDLADNCPAPLNDQCFLEDSSGCCPTYNCSLSVCLDHTGTPQAEGALYYDSTDQCTLVQCINSTEVEVFDLSDVCPPPPGNALCSIVNVVNCCPVYSCPEVCVHNGNVYNVTDTWFDDDQHPCVQYRCEEFGIITEVKSYLPCPNTPTGCVPVTLPFECCPFKYNCMFDMSHNLIPMAADGSGPEPRQPKPARL